MEWIVSHYLHGGDPPNQWGDDSPEEYDLADEYEAPPVELTEEEKLKERRRNGLA